MQTFQQSLTSELLRALKSSGLPAMGEVVPATDARFGDYQANVALVLAKQRGENPRRVAQQIVDQLDVSLWADPPTIAGAGFINFTLKPEAVAQRTTELLGDERLGVPFARQRHRIVIDFGSPNVAKPMHVGHIRSTIIGDALARIASFLGHDVIRDNHIGDWGTQFGMVIYGWKHLLNRQALARDPIAELVRIYKETNELAKTDPAVRDACRNELVKLQSGEEENLLVWKECVALSLKEFEATYQILDVHYDIQRGESFYNERLPAVVDRLLKSGLAERSEGAICVFFRDIPELNERPLIIQKSDGGFNYATTDIATVDYRVNDLQRDTLWYVVGAPQTLHFKQIFEIARREGYTADFRHIPFGNVLGEDRKMMKTRSGENVSLSDLLEQAMTRAREMVEQKNPDLTETEKEKIAQIIGIGAVKYADLSQYRMTDYVFSWDRMLALQGNTAPYLQNAYVRIRSIFRKGELPSATGKGSQTPSLPGDLNAASVAEDTNAFKASVSGDTSPLFPGEKVETRAGAGAEIVLNDGDELALAKKLTQFAEVVPQVLNDFRPNLLANYLFELANVFHGFYESCPVLKASEPARSTRLALCELTARTLQGGLALLGIQVPEQM